MAKAKGMPEFVPAELRHESHVVRPPKALPEMFILTD